MLAAATAAPFDRPGNLVNYDYSVELWKEWFIGDETQTCGFSQFAVRLGTGEA